MPGLHSVGAPLEAGERDVPWPCNDTKYIVHFPEERLIWSYGSGYGGNALLGKKCYSLRIASVKARDEGWMAEHMLIAKLTSPENKIYYIAAAFPSACGKTNLAMLEPTLPGWKVETIGDDIAWIRIGEDGRFYAVNPENGFFGVAPGTDCHTNPNAMRTIAKGNSIFTNVALTDDGDIWWEGMGEPPAHLTAWKKPDWTPDSDEPARAPELALLHADRAVRHPRPRNGTTRRACRSTRSSSAAAGATPSRWSPRPATGSTACSWARRCRPRPPPRPPAQVGVVRRDPMAMLPFIGYNAGDYFAHWIEVGKGADAVKLPKIFYVNWFRRDAEGKFVWPGFGENIRVLKWALERIEGTAARSDTPIGRVPTPDALDVAGPGHDRGRPAAGVNVDVDEWRNELPHIEEWFDKIGPQLPTSMRDELSALRLRLAE